MTIRRAWFVMVADVELQRDTLGNPTEQPVTEPTVLGMTYNGDTAERALAALKFDKTGQSMVRSGVEVLPDAIVDALPDDTPETEDDLAARVLSMVDV